MTLEEQIKLIVANAEREHELAEEVPTAEQNAANFVAWCDAQAIVSQPDNLTRA